MPIDDQIPNDLASLLRDARTETSPAGAKDRVWAKTMAHVGGPAPLSPSSWPSSAASAVRTAAVAGFAAGLFAGIAGTYVAASMLFAETPNVVYVPVEPTPREIVETTATPAPTPTATTVAVLNVPKPKPKPTAIVAVLAANEAEVGTERVWLDAARTALNRGDFDAAMDSLEQARIRFPRGTLSEEREAIGVGVLIARGDLESARLAVTTFRKRHEGSLFLPGIEEAMREMESRR